MYEQKKVAGGSVSFCVFKFVARVARECEKAEPLWVFGEEINGLYRRKLYCKSRSINSVQSLEVAEVPIVLPLEHLCVQE